MGQALVDPRTLDINKVLFVVASDDSKWVKHHVIHKVSSVWLYEHINIHQMMLIVFIHNEKCSLSKNIFRYRRGT